MRQTGFTLIELLITISILAVLTTMGMVLYQGVLSKTRDSVRKSDLNKLATALEIYAQKKGSFINPVTSCPTSNDSTSTFYDNIASNLSDGVVPKDPKDNKTLYCYLSENGSTFTLCANLENGSDPDKNTLCPTGYNYGVVPK